MTAGRDEGQAAVELALVLPLVAVLLLAVAQVAVVARDQILVVHAAREGARVAAVDPDPAVVRRAVLRSADLEPGRLHLDLSDRPPGAVAVALRYRSPTHLPLIGAALPDVTLGSKATMRDETPGGRVRFRPRTAK